MENLDQLKNKGFYRIGDQKTSPEEKTIVVVGLARSGTSIIAGALSHLGVYMGAKVGPPVFEDVHLSSAVENNDPKKIEHIIQEYNASYKIWGYKRPASLEKIFLLHHQFRNPHYIIMFRDLFSIANRNRISVKSDMVKNMRSSLHEYETIIKFLTQKSPNALLVAFDKALNHKESLVEHLVSFCGISSSWERIESAEKFITPDPKDYLDSSRITKSRGFIGKVTREGVSGWARYQNNERSATVCLMVDNKKIAETMADVFSQRLLDENIHSKGKCGFVFDNFPLDWDKGAMEIRVKVIDDIHDLANSPHIVQMEDPPPGKTSLDKIKTIYLHAGLHKTGTTSIQNALYENRALLQKNNMHYLQKWVRNHSIPLYLLFCDQNIRYNYHICVKKGLSRSEVDVNRKEYRDILLEAFARANFETFIFSGEDVSILTQENLNELKALFKSSVPGVEIKIIISLRDPLQLITSRVQERIKSGQSISDKLFVEVGKTGFQKTIEKFHGVFGKQNVILYKFEDALAHDQGPVGFFMELIGINKKDFPNFKKRQSNKSLSDKTVEIISYINGKQPLIKDGKISEGRVNGDTTPLHKIRGEKFQLYQNKSVEKIIEQSKADMKWLKSNTGIVYDIHGADTDEDVCIEEIKYDIDFFEDIKTIYPVLSSFIKGHVHEYMKMLDSTVEHKESRENIVKVLNWINAYNSQTDNTKQNKNIRSILITRLKNIKNHLFRK